MLLKRAWPCASRFVPVGAPIGFSGALSSVGASVFSAHSFSDGAGWRPSKTSEIGLSATVLDTSIFGLFSDIRLPTNNSDDRGAIIGLQNGATDRAVGEASPFCLPSCPLCPPVVKILFLILFLIAYAGSSSCAEEP